MATEQARPRTPMEILQAALRKEKNAYAFYTTLLQESTVGFLSDMLEELRDAEFHHIKMIEKKIASLARG